MSGEVVDPKIAEFFAAYVASVGGKITPLSNEVFTVTYANGACQKFTYHPAVSRAEKIDLIAKGSPFFQQILQECSQNGVLTQVTFKPKGGFEGLLKTYFKDDPFSCKQCGSATVNSEASSVCLKLQPCFHQINNGKITSIKILKTQPAKYYQFYYDITFQNRIRPKSEETLCILLDQDGNVLETDELAYSSLLENEALGAQEENAKLKAADFESLKAAVDQKLDLLVQEKLVLFDLPLKKEIAIKLKSFGSRLKRERREQVISRKHDFDYQKWQANYQALLKAEEEAYLTHVTVKLVNLLVLCTVKVKYEINLSNNSSISGSFIVGVDYPTEATCPLCKKSFFEGYATQDGLYVCRSCIRQSIDTGKVYSKKAALTLDPILNEYIEPDGGFLCSVCGKRHSRLLQFRCSHDNSYVCIQHFELCDTCGKAFSKLNLKYGEEFKRLLCPKHTTKEILKET